MRNFFASTDKIKQGKNLKWWKKKNYIRCLTLFNDFWCEKLNYLALDETSLDTDKEDKDLLGT